jgi:hypothetical protein
VDRVDALVETMLMVLVLPLEVLRAQQESFTPKYLARHFPVLLVVFLLRYFRA